MLTNPIYYYSIFSVVICIFILLKANKNRQKSQKVLQEVINRQKVVERSQYYHFNSNLPTMALLTKKLTNVATETTNYHVSLIKMGRTTPLFHSIEKYIVPMQSLIEEINALFTPFALAVHDNEYLIMAFVSQEDLNHSKAKIKQKQIMEKLPKCVDFSGTPVPIDYAISSLSLNGATSFFGIEKVERRLSFDMHMALQRVDGSFYHSEKLYKKEMLNKHIAKEISNSLANGAKEFDMLLQPIYESSNTDTPYSFEALIRWRNASKIGPATFIPVVSQIPHLHYQITKLMLTKVVAFFERQFKEERAQIPISINISTEDLETEGFYQTVQQLCQNKSRILRRLIFEIIETEKLAMDDTVKYNMEKLAGLGVRFAIDDFGSGYANFELLKNPSIHYIKIDKRYAKAITEEENSDHFLLDCMIDLCRKTSRKVVIEGIEEYQQVKYLERHGKVYFQGYYFCTPISQRDALLMCKRSATF